jgi:hypothetical protein
MLIWKEDASQRSASHTANPLVTVSGAEFRGVGRQNGFTYEADPNGLTCPFGAHIRRANPRSADMPRGRQGLISRLLRTLDLKHGAARRPDLRKPVSPDYPARTAIRRRHRPGERVARRGLHERNIYHFPQCEYLASVRVHPVCLDRQQQVQRDGRRNRSPARQLRRVSGRSSHGRG